MNVCVWTKKHLIFIIILQKTIVVFLLKMLDPGMGWRLTLQMALVRSRTLRYKRSMSIVYTDLPYRIGFTEFFRHFKLAFWRELKPTSPAEFKRFYSVLHETFTNTCRDRDPFRLKSIVPAWFRFRFRCQCRVSADSGADSTRKPVSVRKVRHVYRCRNERSTNVTGSNQTSLFP